MITYTVTIQWMQSGRKRVLEKVKGDGMLPIDEVTVGAGEEPRTTTRQIPVRFFVLEDETRFEVGLSEDVLIEYSKERWNCIADRMAKEAQQDLKVEKG